MDQQILYESLHVYRPTPRHHSCSDHIKNLLDERVVLVLNYALLW